MHALELLGVRTKYSENNTRWTIEEPEKNESRWPLMAEMCRWLKRGVIKQNGADRNVHHWHLGVYPLSLH